MNVSNVVDRIRRLDLASNMNEARFDDYDNLATTLTKRAKEEDLFDNIKVILAVDKRLLKLNTDHNFTGLVQQQRLAHVGILPECYHECGA